MALQRLNFAVQVRRNRCVSNELAFLDRAPVHLGLTNMCALHDFWQQAHDSSPCHRFRIHEVEQAIVIVRHGRDMKHAANPRAIREAGKRQCTVKAFIAKTQRDVRRCDAVPQAAQNSEQVNQLTHWQANASRHVRDLGIKSDAGTVGEVAIIASTGIDLSTRCATAYSVGQQRGGVFPEQWNGTCLGEIVAGAGRDESEFHLATGPQNAIDRFVDTAISTGNEQSPMAVIDGIKNQRLNMPGRTAGNWRVRNAIGLQYGADGRYATAAATAAGGRVEKKWNCLVGQCLLSAR